MTTMDETMTRPTRVRAAGGVLLDGDPPKVLVVHRPAYDDWSLPKGKLDRDETWEDAATREIHEETGVTARLGVELTPTRYTDRKGRPKLVRWWRMHVVEVEDREPDDEVDELRWVSPDQAHSLLTYDTDRALLDEALAAHDHRTVLVVRHTDAGDRNGWDGDDGRRPLSPAGLAQAVALADRLAPFEVRRVVSSPLVRCVQTAEPLVRDRALEVVEDDRIAEGAPPSATWDLLGESGTGTVLVSHGDVIGSLVGRLRELGLVDGDAEWAKGSTWVLRLDDHGTPRAADHLAAPRTSP